MASQVRKYITAPVEVEAFRFSGWTSSFSRYPKWFMEPEVSDRVQCIGGNRLWEKFDTKPPFECAAIISNPAVFTLRADFGDFVVRHANGDVTVCDPDTFAATYNAV